MKKLGFLFVLFCLISNSSTYSQTDYFTSFDGVKIAYNVEGEGAPVLLIHGFINSRKSWRKTVLMKTLINEGYKVIVPDLRGNGDSDKPQDEKAYDNDAEVKDIMQLIDHLGVRKYTAIGYSRGSIVLAKLLTKDKRVDKAVLGGMGVDFTNPDWDRRIQFSNAFNGQTNEMTQGAVDYATSINADLRSLHLQQKFQPVTSLDELAKLKQEVLVIAGNEDLDNGDPNALQKAIPNANLQLVIGDHNGTYKTEAFSNAILQFLNN